MCCAACGTNLEPVILMKQMLLLTLSFALAGCGGTPSTEQLPVEGIVRVDGQPLKNGSVRFVPDKSKGNTYGHEPVGQIGVDGKYTLSSLGQSGAPPGWYLVGVVSTYPSDPANPYALKSNVAARFNDPNVSKIAVEVSTSPAPGAYDFNVMSK